MENKLPFTSYDFWAYLSAGFLLLFVVDHVAGTNWLMRETWTVVQSIVAFSCAYAVGHVNASMSSFIFEQLLVGKFLGAPRDILFKQGKTRCFIRTLIPGYFKLLPEATRTAAIKRAEVQNIRNDSEAMFWAAFSSARATPVVMSRLDNFLNMYGFCRNVALVSFIDAGLLYWFWRWGAGTDETLTWICVSLVLGLGMTLRYLKFFRHYAVEVFTCFAHNEEPNRAK